MEQDAMQGIMGLDNAPRPMDQGASAPMNAPIPEVSAQQMQAFERARQEIPPTEFAQEIMRAGEEIDPAEIAELRQQLMAANLPMELILAMLTMVEGLLAEPGNYAQLRAELLAEGVPEDLLPEQFDGEFFGALQLALEQMIAMPQAQAVQAFAQGGLATLKPIAQELQRYGRNGDTMLAHITPQEARMLQRMGGSGTINPMTGLPEFFLGKVVKSIGNAFKSAGKAVVGAVKSVASGVKKFVKSPVGKIVTAVALGFFLGPVAASAVGISSMVGVAAVSGFVGGFGSSILGGGNLKDSLISGATGAVLAGAGAGIMGGTEAFAAGSYTGPTTISGQWEQLKSGVTNAFGGAPGGAEAMPVDMAGPIQGTPLAPPTAPTAPTAPTVPTATAPTATAPAAATPATTSFNVPVPSAAPVTDPTMTIGGMQNMASTGVQTGAQPGFLDRLTSGVSDFFAGGPKVDPTIAAQQAGQQAVANLGAGAPAELQAVAYQNAYKSAFEAATPSVLRQYGPLVAGGLGVMALTGGFNEQDVEAPGYIPTETGYDLLQQYPEQYGVTLGPVQTQYATPQQQPYPGRYELAQNPYLTQAQPMTLAKGGPANPEDFPRRNGQINGPGTETSDSIPAMLSDGEFVFTARAVRGAGNGSRRAGAKRMYQMMKQFERNA